MSDGGSYGELWQVLKPGSALVCREFQGSFAGSCTPSDHMPALWPWVVALPLHCLQVLWLHPEDPLPGPCAALL